LYSGAVLVPRLLSVTLGAPIASLALLYRVTRGIEPTPCSTCTASPRPTAWAKSAVPQNISSVTKVNTSADSSARYVPGRRDRKASARGSAAVLGPAAASGPAA